MPTLQPLPDEVLVAARLRRMAADLILEAETLEAKAGRQPKQNPAVALAEFRAAMGITQKKGRKKC